MIENIENINIELVKTKDNLSKSERLALSQLRSNTDLIIKESDKGGATVLMTKSYCKETVHDHLHGTDTYEVLSEDLDHENIVMEKLKEFAEKYDEILSPKEVYISDFPYNTANFYCLPKIHKNKQLEDLVESKPSKYIKMADPPKIPGRPICAGPISHTHRLSNLLDIILKQLVYKVKS